MGDQLERQVDVERVINILKEQLGNLHVQLALTQTRLEEVEAKLIDSPGGES